MRQKLINTVDILKLGTLPDDDLLAELLLTEDSDVIKYLGEQAAEVRKEVYGNSIYIRGLIEFTNICKNDCLYCGIRRSQKSACRYRLTAEEIMNCCRSGYDLGFRTFVLQGGEDPYWDDERLASVVRSIKGEFPGCAVTLSVGERSCESYRCLFEAGADRYLLRHETAEKSHYQKLHPAEMSFDNRMNALRNLKEIGYQTGCGFMVGTPGQTIENIIKDIKFVYDFKPAMCGIGPFISAKGTPFENEPSGSSELTIRILSIIRLLLPKILLPATTALGTASSDGRARGILAGANVIMPNLSPADVRNKYALYDNKLNTGCEASEKLAELVSSMKEIGYNIVVDRGDNPDYRKKD